MEQLRINKRTKPMVLVGLILVILCIVYVLFLLNYLFFHALIEGVNISAMAVTSVLAIATYHYSKNGFLLSIGYAYVLIVILDFFHGITQAGVGILPVTSDDISARIWIGARFFESIALLVAPFYLRRNVKRVPTFEIYFLIFGAIACILSWPHIFQGEQVIGKIFGPETFWGLFCILLCITGLFRLMLRQARIIGPLYRITMSSMILLCLSLLCYQGVSQKLGLLVFLSHGFNTAAHVLMAFGVVILGIRAPYQLIFAELKTHAISDPLTGLYNRQGFGEIVGKELRLALREGSQFGILLIDLDNFKTVNDRFGHIAGDEILKQFAKLLRGTVGRGNVAFRLGGDEFLVFLKDVTPGKIEQIKDRIEKTFEKWIAVQDNARLLGMSIGEAVWKPGDSDDIGHLLEIADKRMYQNKRKNAVRYFQQRRKAVGRDGI
jgi:diguanylate cyclase (GGDEF)-like protein